MSHDKCICGTDVDVIMLSLSCSDASHAWLTAGMMLDNCNVMWTGRDSVNTENSGSVIGIFSGTERLEQYLIGWRANAVA